MLEQEEIWEEGVAERNYEAVTAIISPTLVREDGGVGSEGDRLSLEKEGKKNVLLMFAFLFSATWISNYILILASNKLSPLSWSCLACDDN